MLSLSRLSLIINTNTHNNNILRGGSRGDEKKIFKGLKNENNVSRFKKRKHLKNKNNI